MKPGGRKHRVTILNDVIVMISVTDSCACSVQVVSMNKGSSDSSNVSTTLGPEEPRLPEEGRNKRRTVKRNTVEFCFVLLFLVLEMLVCVILPLIVAKSKYR